MKEFEGKTSPFVYHEPVIPPIFIGREQELQKINEALFIDKDSLVLYGNSMLGKSSIVHTIFDYLNKDTQKRVLPIIFNAIDFITAIERDFLGLIVHQICVTVWTQLVEKRYSELIESSMLYTKGGMFKSPEEQALGRIYKIVSSEKLTGTGKVGRELGGKFFVEGKLSVIDELVSQRKPLASFEFMYLLDELNDIIKAYDFDSIVVICDDLNHLPDNTDSEILKTYFNIFSSKKIQFITIVDNPYRETRLEDARKLIESFNHSLEITTFDDPTVVKSIVDMALKRSNQKMLFDVKCYQPIFELTNGNPYWIQKACDMSFRKSLMLNLDTIGSNIVEEILNSLKGEIEFYNERMQQGATFRKSLY